MSFNLAAAAAGSADLNLLNVFHPSPQVAARGQFPQAVVPRNDSNVPIINMFMDSAAENMEYVASIVDVCPDRTTFAVRCTSGPSYLESGVCGSEAVVRPTIRILNVATER